jgi:hypothetical protein
MSVGGNPTPLYRRISNLFFRSKVDQNIEDELKSQLMRCNNLLLWLIASQ